MTELRALTPHASIPREQEGRDRRQRHLLRTFLPELVDLERILAEAPEAVATSVVDRITLDELALPVYRVDLGSCRPDAPAVLMVGGVHGLERIGAQVVIAWHLAIGNVVIPKSVTESRIRENYAALEVTLDADDIEAINALDRSAQGEGRIGADPAVSDFA